MGSQLALGKYQGIYGTKFWSKSVKKWKVGAENANSTNTTAENANSKRIVKPKQLKMQILRSHNSWNANSEAQEQLKMQIPPSRTAENANSERKSSK